MGVPRRPPSHALVLYLPFLPGLTCHLGIQHGTKADKCLTSHPQSARHFRALFTVAVMEVAVEDGCRRGEASAGWRRVTWEPPVKTDLV